MKFKHISQASGFNPATYVAEEFLEGSQSNVRIIRLAPGIALPPHKHGESDLMLFAVEGAGLLETPEGLRELSQGEMVYIAHDEELRVSNKGTVGLTLLAFLTPKFPPRS